MTTPSSSYASGIWTVANMSLYDCTATTNTYLSAYDQTSTGATIAIRDDRINIPKHLEYLLYSSGYQLPDGGRLKIDSNSIPYIHYDHGDDKSVPGRHRGVIDLASGIHDLEPNTVLRAPDGTCFQVMDDGSVSKEVFINAREKVIDVSGGSHTLYESLAFCHFSQIHIPDGDKANTTLTLPNGSVITINKDDSITIDDANARQLYKTNPIKDYNPYLQVSDVLENFVKFCGEQNVKKKEFGELPIKLFILWIILKAAEADGDDTQEVEPLLLTQVKKQKAHTHRCLECGKYLPKDLEEKRIDFCSPEHAYIRTLRMMDGVKESSRVVDVLA